MKGQCLCGEIQFDVVGELSNVYQCACSICRKASGTSRSASFITSADGVQWTKGQTFITGYQHGNGFSTNFCKQCGSPVPNKMSLGDYLCVPAGALDGEVKRNIKATIFVGSKACWDDRSEDHTIYDEAPKSVADFFRSLE